MNTECVAMVSFVFTGRENNEILILVFALPFA